MFVEKVSASCMVIGLLAWPEILTTYKARKARHKSKHGALRWALIGSTRHFYRLLRTPDVIIVSAASRAIKHLVFYVTSQCLL